VIPVRGSLLCRRTVQTDSRVTPMSTREAPDPVRQPAAGEHSPPKGLRHCSRMLGSAGTGIRQPVPEEVLAVYPLSRSTTAILARDENALPSPWFAWNSSPLHSFRCSFPTRILARRCILDKPLLPAVLPFFRKWLPLHRHRSPPWVAKRTASAGSRPIPVRANGSPAS
jgi:hypothetical protein